MGPTTTYTGLPAAPRAPSPFSSAALRQERAKAWAAASPACRQSLELAKELGGGSMRQEGEAVPPAARLQVSGQLVALAHLVQQRQSGILQ